MALDPFNFWLEYWVVLYYFLELLVSLVNFGLSHGLHVGTVHLWLRYYFLEMSPSITRVQRMWLGVQFFTGEHRWDVHLLGSDVYGFLTLPLVAEALYCGVCHFPVFHDIKWLTLDRLCN